MSVVRLRVVAIFVAASIAIGYAYQSSPANRPWPPGVQAVPDLSPALSPAEALKTFYMAPGYHLELVAAEPLVQDPIAMDWDPDGRLWVVEMPGFVPNLDAPEPNMAPIGRVVVLEDTNNDGRMDKRTVFADGLVLARSLKVLDRGVLVAEPPNVWLMHDTNGDLKMDTKELVTQTYGRREGRVEQNANGFLWGMDNWMHTANADVFLRLKNGKFEVQKTLSRGEWSAAQDDAGRVYRNTNSEALHVDFVPTSYYARHPGLLRTRGSYDRLDDDATNEVWPVRPTVSNRSYQFGILREDKTIAAFTSVCAPLIYRGDRLPAELHGNVFVAEPAANLVSRLILKDDGRTLRLSRAYERAEFLASTDERFRPVFLSDAPDGTIYIVDMYRGVIQQRADITEYLRDQIKIRKLENPTGLGRIYRVMHETTKRASPPPMSKGSTATLIDTLSDPNGWRRDTAQRLLVERGDRSGVKSLENAATGARDWRTRIHALWTLDGIDAVTPEIVIRALADPSRDVRLSAVRVAERFASAADTPVRPALLKLLDDPDWNVQQQLAASLGALPAGSREAAIAGVLERHGDSPVVMDAALSGTRGVELGVLREMLKSPTRTPQREAAITMLAGTLVRGALDAGIQSLFQMIGDGTRPEWQRSDLLRGSEVALLNTSMPGTPGRGTRAAPPPSAPCPTCPGGRAGPGGAYAFEQVPATGRGNANARRSVRLNREPVALTALATSRGDLATRAAAVVARVEWPGKPGMAAPIAPLSPEEEVRFNAGAEIYKNVCITCHQPDGRGQEKLAASLVGSTLVLASPDVPARILLNGKDGPIGLMPPVGSVLNDDQIAAVLTYIRREWGQAGTAVGPAAVKNTRALVAGRTKPWTDAELLAIVK